MLSAALRGNGSERAFDDLQKRLLHALARYVAGNGDVFALARNLVDFVDIDDAALRALDVVIGVLNKLQKDIFDVLADVPRLRKRGGVAGGEGNVEYLCQRARKQRFTAPCGPEKKNIALLDLYLVLRLFRLHKRVYALVMVIHGDGKHLLRFVLADDIFVQLLFDLGGLFQRHFLRLILLDRLVHHRLADIHAVVADEHPVRPRDEAAHFLLRFSAE